MEVIKQTNEFVIEYINKKIEENEKIIRYTFYELRVKNNLSEVDVNDSHKRINYIQKGKNDVKR